MQTLARGMMARKETVGVEHLASFALTGVPLTYEYERVFVRLGEVHCPLETNNVLSINQSAVA